MIQPERIVCQVAGEADIHEHRTFEDLAKCVNGRGLLVVVARDTTAHKGAASAPMAAVSGPAPAASSPDASGSVVVKNKDALPTVKQLGFISLLGGSWRDAAMGNRAEASALIAQLQNKDTADAFKLPSDPSLKAEEWDMYPTERDWRNGILPSYWDTPDTWGKSFNQPAEVPEPPAGSSDPSREVRVTPIGSSAARVERKRPQSKIKHLMPLFANVPDGYFAVEVGEGDKYAFLRISTVASGAKAGCRKVQTIHGERLEDAWALWPSGTISVYSPSVEDLIIGVITDYPGAMRRYSKKIGRCCRCTKRLTDDRSIHYGIGPECEKYLPGVITIVDMENGFSYEEKR